MSTNVETAKVPGYRPMVAPWYGCNGNTCKSHCWYFNRIVPRMAANPMIKCPDCKTGRPHLHFDDLNRIRRMNKSHCFSGHMGEIADLETTQIEVIRQTTSRDGFFKPGHIYQLFTHRPMEFYAKYPDWPSNVWAMGTFTEGLIQFPPNLKAGVIGAYCEPVIGEMRINGFDESPIPSWLVVGLLNHKHYKIPLDKLGIWIKDLIADATLLRIPVWCKDKSDDRWSKMGIIPVQSWPI